MYTSSWLNHPIQSGRNVAEWNTAKQTNIRFILKLYNYNVTYLTKTFVIVYVTIVVVLHLVDSLKLYKFNILIFCSI